MAKKTITQGTKQFVTNAIIYCNSIGGTYSKGTCVGGKKKDKKKRNK